MIQDAEGHLREDGKSLGLCALGQSFTKQSRAPVIYKISVGPWKVTGKMQGRSFQSTGMGGTWAKMTVWENTYHESRSNLEVQRKMGRAFGLDRW